MTDPDEHRAALVEVLEDARRRGFLGPEPVQRHLEHSVAIAEALGPFRGTFLDLGAGGGIPGLVLAVQWPTARGILLDAHRQRCTFLEDAAGRLALADRVGVRCGRAEVLARTPELRGAADLVVARAFGAPAVTAECAVGFLAAGGRLVVSEPPEGTVGPDRWPPEALADLGLSPAVTLRAPGAGVAVMTALGPPDDRWPRGDGRPAKSPRW